MLKKIFRAGLLAAGLLLFLSACLAGWFFLVTKDVRLDEEKLVRAETALVFADREGSPLHPNRAFPARIGFREMPKDLISAFVAVEDKNFFRHRGFDLKRMLAAAFENLTSFSFKEGASTISQQLVKNTQLTPEKSLIRKCRELRLAAQLESRYSKEEILEFYLNTIYFGRSAYGVESAAFAYFGKSAKELTLPECATLAAVVRSPLAYSPAVHPENCLARRDLVLGCMCRQGYLTEDECAAARKEPLVLAESGENAVFDPYLDAAAAEAAQILGIGEDELANGGYRLHTYCDCGLQQAAFELLQTEGCFDKGPAPAACVILCDNADLGASVFASRNITRLYGYARQPGSVFKPLFTYAPALEKGVIAPATQLLDQKTDFNGYAPANYDDRYYGQISVREALSLSLNVPAVQILNAVGTDYAAEFAGRLGIATGPNSLADALGATSEDIPLTDLAGAYAALANAGRFAPLRFVESITDREGRLLYRAKADPTPAMREDTAALVTDMLRDAVRTGTAKNLRGFSFDLAAKTGTVGTREGNSDAYSISYTSAHTLLCYQGGKLSNRVMGGTFPTLMAREFYKTLYREQSPAPFAACPEVTACELDLLSLKNDRILALADENAPAEYRLTELFSVRHLPRDRATTFSRPCLAAPDFRMTEEGPCITFEARPYYCYTVTRNGEVWQELSGREGRVSLTDPEAGGREATYEIWPSFCSREGRVFEGDRYRETFVLPLPLLPDEPLPDEEHEKDLSQEPAEDPRQKSPWWW